jgi:hypothetical protein
MEKLYFQEEQRFSQVWVWMILITSMVAVITPFAYGIYSQTVLNKSFGNNPTSTSTLIAILLICILIMASIMVFLGKSKLITKITDAGIIVKYPPFINKWRTIVPSEIEKWEIRSYNAIVEYGGYGVKSSYKKGKALNVSGNIGLQLYLKNGKKLLIGTQKKQALAFAVEKLMNKELHH